MVDGRADPPRIVSVAATARGGRPHAEPVALAAAGEGARGATLYVSLEPCSHQGRTPPCTSAIIEAGIARVVSAIEDPDPRVAGRGHAVLRAAGLAVETGLLAAEGALAHRGHLTRVREGRPFVTLKLARTADGFAAGGPGDDRLLITGDAANARTHLLRAHADAVMVGIATVEADDPRLDVRLPGLEDRSPVRIVLDPGLRLSPGSRLAASADARATWVVCTPHASCEAERHLRDAGLEVLRAAAGAAGRLDLRAVLHDLATRGITSLLCEGGPTLANALQTAGLVDEVVLMTSARCLGSAGLPALGPAVAEGLRRDFALVAEEVLGDDRLTRYERTPCSPVS